MTDLYTEASDAGNLHRARQLEGIRDLIAGRRSSADAHRKNAFSPDLTSPANYLQSLGSYRDSFRKMLGWPLTEEHGDMPAMRRVPVAEDELGGISRVWVESLPGLETYGLLLVPRGPGLFPLVVCQHGGGGTPELCCGLLRSSIYNDVPRRFMRRGCAVFAPQLPMWREEYGPTVDRVQIDRDLKQVGGSAAALGVCEIRRSLDALSALEFIDETRIAMVGLSWGGFYAMVTAALDTRIRVALNSCFFNDRYAYELGPAIWRGAALEFLDAEIAGLVCPRPLCIEVGTHDDEFAVEGARPEAGKVRAVYERLGIEERFRYHEHAGGHEFDRENGGIEFVVKWLQGQATEPRATDPLGD